jgi:hypothetical protein
MPHPSPTGAVSPTKGVIGRLLSFILILLLTGVFLRSAQAAAPGLPAGWDSLDIGTNLTGSFETTPDGTWSIAAAGHDIWQYGDAFRYTYFPMTGDCSVTCRVTNQTKSDNWAKVGVMIRDGLAPGARHCMLVRTPGNGVDQQWRAELDKESFNVGANTYPGRLPVWLRVQRTGSLFSAFASRDGLSWQQIGRVLQINMGSRILAGIALTSHNDNTLCQADVDHVVVSPEVAILGPEGLQGWPGSRSALLSWNGIPEALGYNVYRLTPTGPLKLHPAPLLDWFFEDMGDLPAGLPDGVPQRYVVTGVLEHGESLPSAPAVVTPMLPLDGKYMGYNIGTSTPGSATLNAGLLTVEGSGADIWDNSDRMYFLGAPRRGATDLTARLLKAPWRTSDSAKVGLMIRESRDGTARNVFICATPDHGLLVQWRDNTGGGTGAAEGGRLDTYPLYLRVKRSGELIQCYRSADGLVWEKVGETVKLEGLGPTVFIGFAVTAHKEGSLTHAEFDQITLH